MYLFFCHGGARQVGVKKIETLASGYRKFVPTKQLTNFNLNLQQQQRFNFYQRYTH